MSDRQLGWQLSTFVQYVNTQYSAASLDDAPLPGRHISYARQQLGQCDRSGKPITYLGATDTQGFISIDP
ncbi:MAG: hypothetical protein M3Y50_05075 [Acidobacteriota bacterium]|nr:hypothetical protein [Acidobacteriota bacterium]